MDTSSQSRFCHPPCRSCGTAITPASSANRKLSQHLVVAIKTPHVHTRTSGLENPDLQSRYRAANKLIFSVRCVVLDGWSSNLKIRPLAANFCVARYPTRAAHFPQADLGPNRLETKDGEVRPFHPAFGHRSRRSSVASESVIGGRLRRSRIALSFV
jgi:hypothetical protein